ncbi:MAG TPA: excinuclease ABC subunit UvrA [Candidatus Kapabacteria bacterium]|nr:excinuclease ABC subunit UvrA [Candidatus Kapabacteria bacterium]
MEDNLELVESPFITVRGAREHNLKDLDVDLPRNALVVITGLSGSGKSSLAFDTIYAEGQRRYVESLSLYARQFLGMLERPDVDLIEGLSPAISIEQKSISSSPRSTVGTITEIYDYLRLLYARAGTQYCINCNIPVQRQTVDQIIDAILKLPESSMVNILAPLIRGRKGHYRELFQQIQRDGFTRVRVDGELTEIVEGMQLDRYKVHNIEVVIDRITLRPMVHGRLSESVETALKVGGGTIIASVQKGTKYTDILYSEKLSCPNCGKSYEDLAPNSFSFNSPYGACPDCDGLGEKKEFDRDIIIPDMNKSLAEEGIAPLGKPRPTWQWSQVKAVLAKHGGDIETPIKKLPKGLLEILLNGAGTEQFEILYTYSSGRTAKYRHRYAGILGMLKESYDNTSSNGIREWAESFMNTIPCEACHGGRLKKESLFVRIDDLNIHDVVSASIKKCLKRIESFRFTNRQQEIARPILKEITSRLKFLLDVGLDYLTLNRGSRTLSGGEAQRIRLATQIGSQLVGVMYVLDEPSIGLHQRDNLKLITSLKNLRDLGNSVIVVEHDREMIEHADYVVDLGPGAGEHGGKLVKSGPPALFQNGNAAPVSINGNGALKSYTAEYLSGMMKIEIPAQRRKGNKKFITLTGATGNNLKNTTLKIPLGMLVSITGVSGSGKSSLILETLYKILAKEFYHAKDVPLPYAKIEGLKNIDKVIDIDQSPIGRTPRSNPATYTGLFTPIRDLFAQLPESKIRGYKPGRFSFNVKGGRCEECEGDGVKKIEMNFLPDVYVQCELCKGMRYNRETLEVHFKGKSIADVLGMTVEEALQFFQDHPVIKRKLQTLYEVGLGYIRLGQQATTLSGGEAQRVKLSEELSKVSTGNTLYILDEPTTGLHFEDIRMLLSVLNSLVEKGNTAIVIEHNLDVIKASDWVIDLGPEGGDEGGYIVAEGTPEAVAQSKKSYTGQYLQTELARDQHT